MDSNATNPVVYQFHVKLRGISPAIWRRLLLRADSTTENLHYTVQLAMGWTDSHLNRFFNSRSLLCVIAYRRPSVFGTCQRFPVVGFRLRERFLYEYDFGDSWQHDIRLERKVVLDSQRTLGLPESGKMEARFSSLKST